MCIGIVPVYHSFSGKSIGYPEKFANKKERVRLSGLFRPCAEKSLSCLTFTLLRVTMPVDEIYAVRIGTPMSTAAQIVMCLVMFAILERRERENLYF